jgi:hypothetical protein
MRKKTTFIVTTIAVLTIGAYLCLTRLLPQIRTSSRPASCLPASCFCESIAPTGVAQRSNSLSSLAFVFVGVLVLCRRSERGSWPYAYTIVYGVALILIGWGSAFYHASMTFIGQLADVSGMYLLASFAVLLNLRRFFTMTTHTFVSAYVASNLALFYIQLEWPVARRVVFALLIVGILLGEYIARKRGRILSSSRNLLIASSLLGIAFMIWIADYKKLLCAPSSWFQGHALWHILGACAALFLFSYFEESTISLINTKGQK